MLSKSRKIIGKRFTDNPTLSRNTTKFLVSDKLENVDFGAVGVRAHLRYIDKNRGMKMKKILTILLVLITIFLVIKEVMVKKY